MLLIGLIKSKAAFSLLTPFAVNQPEFSFQT